MPKKYLDFVEGDVVIEASRSAPYAQREYTPLTCPHCDSVFVKLPSEQVPSLKASKCLQHLRVCEAFKAKGGEVVSVQERKRADTDADRLEKSIQELEATVASHASTIESYKTTVASHKEDLASYESKMSKMKDEMASILDENAWLKSENAELEESLKNARSALNSQRKRLLSALESVDVHSQMGFPIKRINNGLC